MARRRKPTEETFKTAAEALQAANASFSSQDNWRDHFKNDDFQTAGDLQAFVLFNMLRSLLEQVDPSNERLHLSTIQQNILYSTFKFK